VVPSHLIRLGAQALADMTANVARGEPLVRCQLLASQFNEALKRELLTTSELGPIERSMVVAAANHCRHAASASISPPAMLAEVRSAMASLQFRAPIPPLRTQRPVLRVIDGGLSRA
jgi:hypothetical protein